MKIEPRLETLLEGARALPHGNRTLYEHLHGTWLILRGWRVPASIARAGLIHSVYSTQYYRLALVRRGQRRLVQHTAGVEAERMAHAFCSVDRSRLWKELATTGSAGRTAPPQARGAALDLPTVRALLLVEMANLAEQARAPDDAPAPFMSWILAWRALPFPRGLRPSVLRLDGPLSWRAEAAACKAYASWFRRPAAGRDARHLLKATSLNPFAGEPHLLLAGLATAQGNLPAARRHLRRSIELFEAWHVSWDKRLSLPQWLKLGRGLQRALSSRNADSRQRAAARVISVDDAWPRRPR
jgi:hypothetical protein